MAELHKKEEIDMNKFSKEKNDKAERVAKINEMMRSFCGEHLTPELEG
ncbi:hypothetical protein KJ656_10530 [bacterium]|nr:hypothetical protein [bacterium]